MKSWIGRASGVDDRSPGDLVQLSFDENWYSSIRTHDRIFLADAEDPTLLLGWGVASEVSQEERLVIGDDEEANTPPYPTYYKVHVQVSIREIFPLPLSLLQFLSEDDFRHYEDEYGNQYGGKLKESDELLVSKLNRAIRTRSESGAPVFLSYAKEDSDLAEFLYRYLSLKGIAVWMDKYSLQPGVHWKREIGRAIRGSRAFIALLSSCSVTKQGYVQKELKLGLEVLDEVPPSNIYLIPVRAEPCEPQHDALLDIQWLDLFPDFDKGVEALVAALD